MSLVEAFRFPFYRIFFSVVVGIIALEGFVLTYNHKEDGSLTDGVLIRIIKQDSPQELPLSGQVEIPFIIKTFKYNSTQSANFDVDFFSSTNLEKTDKSYFLKETIPKIKFTGGFVIKDDPFLILENRPDIVIGDHWLFLKFKNWNIIVLTIYLLIAGIVGEFLCTLGDLFIGMCCFGFDPFRCDDELEYCNPAEDNNRKVKISSILKDNSQIADFSELHFSLSRVYAGLFLTMLVIGGSIFIPYSLLLLITVIALVIETKVGCYISKFISKNILIFCILLFCLAILLVILTILGITFKDELLGAITLIFLSFIFLSLSTIFRTQANRIIIRRAQEEQ